MAFHRSKKAISIIKGNNFKNKTEFCLSCFRTKSCLRCFRTKIKVVLKSMRKKIFGGVATSSKDTKILEFNQYRKFHRTLSIIYADRESLIKRTDGCKNNFKNYPRQK